MKKYTIIIYDRSITLSVGCLSSWQDQIKNSLWLGKHSQTSATPKAPRLLIPLKEQRDRTGTVKRQDLLCRKSKKVKS